MTERVEWVPVTPERYQEWLAPVRARLVERAGTGIAAPESTVDRALAAALPDGAGTPGQHLLSARIGGEPAGQAWLGLSGRTACGTTWWGSGCCRRWSGTPPGGAPTPSRSPCSTGTGGSPSSSPSRDTG
ncbi:hypothetical protein AB0I55_06175 [Actinocatenispora sera]|uniref:hypothetical protein n=1 Tax=Actinocatenispora sera TaxID=390989 RepID=UPI0033C2C620